MTSRPHNTSCRRTRREFLWQAGAGFTGGPWPACSTRPASFPARRPPPPRGAPAGAVNPLAPRASQFAPKYQERHLPVYGRWRPHVDTFDHKPKLYGLDGKSIQVKTFSGGHKNEGRVVGPKWNFKPYGQCGKMVSDLFPHVGSCVDDIAFLHSPTADSPIHGSAMLMMNSWPDPLRPPVPRLVGELRPGQRQRESARVRRDARPDGRSDQRAKNWSSGYMPASYQGVSSGRRASRSSTSCRRRT